MRKTLLLTSLLAIVAATGSANADTDVTFGGKYSLSTDTGGVQSGVVTSAPDDITYEYDVTDGSTITDVNYADNPDVTKFTFVDPDGATQNVSFAERFEQGDYVGTSAVTGEAYATTQVIVAGATVSEGNYSYTYTLGGEDIERTLDNPSTFVGDMTALSADYANALSVNVVNGEAVVNGAALTDADDLDYTLYGFTLNDSYYNLDKEGGSFILVRNGEKVTPASGSELETQFNNAQDAYATDVTTLGTDIASTASDWATEKTYYDTAKGFFDADVEKVETLNANYASQAIADNLYNIAQDAQGVAQTTQSANIANYDAAVAVYNASIETTIADGANTAIATELGTGGSIKAAVDGAEQNAKDYADAGDATTLASAKTYADGLDAAVRTDFAAADAATLASAKDYADAGDATTLASAKTYADGLDAAVRTDFAAADAATLASAKGYTDKRINKLDKDLSAGIASSAALSSVAVSGVGKGELSFGAGFGHHNSQSAAAFGAVMGLTDRWSLNAGAGFSNADVTVRAGTNYKIKLF